ncbi:GH25 family lysozyme [Priestia koreensis]|uniref:GH25 family lysozyme n=1 Tax=Priestia koreensis TaxID=284581 RepID=UPI001F55F729|nr:GH25 family lysozyme [Priestia koreensis]UNL86296.1 hypothetical protein IE339_07310 [Priestia koreensis]
MTNKIVDLSHHQGDIDFQKASKEIDLAIIRVQYGSTSIDRQYKQYVQGCKRYRIPFGHYAYARFVSIRDARKEATDFLHRVDPDAKFLAVDVEEVTVKRYEDLIPATQEFIEVCRQAGWKVGLYTGHYFYHQHHMHKIDADFLWIPRYSTEDKGHVHHARPDMHCHLWQYSQRGKVAGIKGHVDLNTIHSERGLDWFCGAQEEQLRTQGERKMNLTDSQWKEMARTYEKAYKKGILSSMEWAQKALSKELTVDEAIFLQTILIGRTL